MSFDPGRAAAPGGAPASCAAAVAPPAMFVRVSVAIASRASLLFMTTSCGEPGRASAGCRYRREEQVLEVVAEIGQRRDGLQADVADRAVGPERERHVRVGYGAVPPS